MNSTNLEPVTSSELRPMRKKSSSLRRIIGRCWRILRTEVFYNWLMYPYGRIAHKRRIATAERSQAHTYTKFYRSPAQLDVLTSRVIPDLLTRLHGSRLRIVVFACSTGAEPYSVASVLNAKFPSLDFQIHASDLHEHTIRQAREARYTKDEVFFNGSIPDEFVDRTFEWGGDEFVVRPKLKEKVTFERVNLLDTQQMHAVQPGHIVFAQNVLCHLGPIDAQKAFLNIQKSVLPGGYLFLDGANLDIRQKLIEPTELVPLSEKLRSIHNETRTNFPPDWWNYYYGTEPYMLFRLDKLYRYSTIFFNPRRNS